MSLSEKIRQLLQVQEEQAARDKTEKDAFYIRSQSDRDAANLQRERLRIEREEFVARQTKVILEESGTLEAFQEIDETFLSGKWDYHGIYYGFNKGIIQLAWSHESTVIVSDGKQPTTKHWNDVGDRLVESKGTWPNGVNGLDYFTISALVDHDSKSLTINGQKQIVFTNPDWKNKSMIEGAIAEAFTNPRHFIYQNSPPDTSGQGQW